MARKSKRIAERQKKAEMKKMEALKDKVTESSTVGKKISEDIQSYIENNEEIKVVGESSIENESVSPKVLRQPRIQKEKFSMEPIQENYDSEIEVQHELQHNNRNRRNARNTVYLTQQFS